ncbi:MAG: uroporphyrinogen-III C-methyltransferase [Bryobacteraceae bacterium]
MPRPGTVYLIGAGPGDPALITLRGRDLLAQADVVVHDHLANPALLRHAPNALHIYAGKKKADHALSQDDIAALLIEHARAGRTVARLKGGDPYVFGRGGEEAEALASAGIPFEVVPGVTSPLGIAAYCGVPLTHRGHASTLTIVTGHNPEEIDWRAATAAETLVILMGLTTIGDIVQRLIAAGRDPATPALAVRWGTRPSQRTIEAPLADLPAAIENARLKPPATVFIGSVVSLRGKLNWFEKLPLFGQRIVVTRAAAQASEFAERLARLGADVIEYPSIEIHPAPDYADLDAAIARLETYAWLIFTSVNGVRFFLQRLAQSTRDLRAIRGRICAIGPATAAALADAHLKIDLMPKEYVAESVLEAFAAHHLAGARILLPRAAVARDLIPVELANRGADVDVVEAYRTLRPEAPPLHTGRIHWLTFTSSSTARNFFAMAPPESWAGARIASIGPVTSATIREHGCTVHAEADPHTIPGLLDALVTQPPPAAEDR